MELAGESTSGSAKQSLRAQFPELESNVDEFFRFARSLRLSVMSSHIEACAISASKERGLDQFKASNGWLQKYLRRIGIQSSFKLHRKGNAELPANSKEHMAAICSTVSSYALSNICNMD